MNALVFRAPHKKRYFLAGAGALAALALALSTGMRAGPMLPKEVSFAWSVTTGLALLACVLSQWLLFAARLTGRNKDAIRHYRHHRTIGVAALVLFVLHAASMGYAALSVMVAAFLTVSITGIFNPEVVLFGRPWMKPVWSFLHIGLAGLILPLALLHVWAALAFK